MFGRIFSGELFFAGKFFKHHMKKTAKKAKIRARKYLEPRDIL